MTSVVIFYMVNVLVSHFCFIMCRLFWLIGVKSVSIFRVGMVCEMFYSVISMFVM